MKKELYLLLLLCWTGFLPAQHILNGSFEDNDLWSDLDTSLHAACGTISPPAYLVDHSQLLEESTGVITAFLNGCENWSSCQTYWQSDLWNGEYGVVDSVHADSILEFNPQLYGYLYGDTIWEAYPQEGNWYLGIAGCDSILIPAFEDGQIVENYLSFYNSDAFSLAFSEPLHLGQWYQLDYYIRSPQSPYSCWFITGTNSVDIGLSMDASTFGDSLHASYMPQENDSLWILQSVAFKANQAYEHLTCKGHVRPELYGLRALFVDNFVLTPLDGPPEPVDTTVVDTTLISVHELSQKPEGMLLYPNPAAGILYLEVGQSGSKVELRDILGRLQHHAQLQPNAKNSLYLEFLPAGSYLLEVLDAQGQVLHNQKVIKL